MRIRVAYAEFTCEVCGRAIKRGRNYVWRFALRPGNVVKTLRCHLECNPLDEVDEHGKKL